MAKPRQMPYVDMDLHDRVDIDMRRDEILAELEKDGYGQHSQWTILLRALAVVIGDCDSEKALEAMTAETRRLIKLVARQYFDEAQRLSDTLGHLVRNQ
jgi:hypothetical protein